MNDFRDIFPRSGFAFLFIEVIDIIFNQDITFDTIQLHNGIKYLLSDFQRI